MKAFRKPRTRTKGRPSILTPELTEKICNAIKAGAYIETAVAMNDISKATFKIWCRAGLKNPDSPHAAFLASVTRALSESEFRDVYNIDKCAMGQEAEYEKYTRDIADPSTGEIVHYEGELVLNGKGNPIVKKQGFAPDWHASAWRLERKFGKRWGNTQRVETKDVTPNRPKVIVMLPLNGREAKKPDGGS